jgi:hypothetical protein
MPQNKTPSSPAMEFLIGQLRNNPSAGYGEVQAAASAAGYTIYPIMYGRAKALLGLVKVAPRGAGKAAASKAPAAPEAGFGRSQGGRAAVGRAALKPRATKPGRVPRSASGGGDPLQSLEAMIEDMKSVARERDRYQQALAQIADILDEVLEDA